MKKIMVKFACLLVWLFIWILGCMLFDGILHLGGGFLMGAGWVTVTFAELVMQEFKNLLAPGDKS